MKYSSEADAMKAAKALMDSGFDGVSTDDWFIANDNDPSEGWGPFQEYRHGVSSDHFTNEDGKYGYVDVKLKVYKEYMHGTNGCHYSIKKDCPLCKKT